MHAELEESIIRMAAMLKSGAWGPMNLTGPAADLHEEITRLHMDLEEVAATVCRRRIVGLAYPGVDSELPEGATFLLPRDAKIDTAQTPAPGKFRRTHG